MPQETLASDSWTELSIARQGRALTLLRGQVPALADLLAGISRAPRTQEALQEPVSARIELQQQGERVALVELAGAQLRWTGGPAQGGTSFTLRPDPPLLQALQAEVDRLLPR